MGLRIDKGKAKAIIFETEPEPEGTIKYSYIMEMMNSIANELRKDRSNMYKLIPTGWYFDVNIIYYMGSLFVSGHKLILQN